jgi:hypothetical protein
LQDSFERNVTENDVFAIDTSREEIKQGNYPKLSCYEGKSENYPDYDSRALMDWTAEQVIEVWRAEGSPAIPIREGETCFDLAKTLNCEVVNQAHLNAITEWLSNTLKVKRGES